LIQNIEGLREEREALTGAVVRDLLWVTLAWGMIRLCLIPLLQAHPKPAVALLLFQNIFVLAVPFVLWRRGRIFQAAWCMAIGATLLAGGYVFLSGGIRSSGSIAQVAMAIVAAVILGKPGATYIVLPTVAYLAGITIFQAAGGQLPRVLPESYWTALVNLLAAGSMVFAPIPRAMARLSRMTAERHRMSRELQASSRRLESLVNAVEGIVWERDVRTWQFTFVSGQAERLLGYPLSDWVDIENFWLEHIHPDDRSKALVHRKSVAVGKDLSFEYRMIAADGRVVWLRDLVSVVIERGAPIRLRGLIVDVTKLRHTEEALYDRQRRLEMAQTGAVMGIWERDVQSGQSRFNDEWLSMFGFPAGGGPVSQEDCFARIHPEDRRRIEMETEVAIAWESRFDSEFRVVWPDGSLHWISGKGQLLRDAAGTPVTFLGIGIDTTVRRQSEAAIAEAATFLQVVIDSSPNMIFVVDGTGKCILANRHAAAFYGTPSGQIFTDAASRVEAIDPGALTFMKGSADVIRTGDSLTTTETLHAADGTRHWFHSIRVPLTRPDGTIAALGIATDITELKRAEEALLEKENHLRTILNAEPECIMLLAADSSLLEINPAGLAMFEADSDRHVIGENISGLIRPEYRDTLQDLNRRAFDGTPFRLEYEMVGLKGTCRRIETHATALRDGDNRVIAALHVARDITEKKRLETDLQLTASRLLHAKTIAKLGSFSGDLVSGKTVFSEEVYRILGSAPGFLLDGRHLPDADEEGAGRVLHGDHEQVQKAYRDLLADGRDMDVTFRWRQPDKEVRHIQIRGSRELDANGDPLRIFGIIQDVTGHRQTVERLRQLTEHQERVREEERTRIAREIHDELGQQLTGLKMRAAWTQRLLASSSDTVNSDQAHVELSAITEALESTIRTVRRIASELRPPVLDALGLIPALEWLRGTFERDHGIHCVTDLHCGYVSPDAATTVFRVAQEALTNVARHAGASQVQMRFGEIDRQLILDVEDNGQGMRPDSFSRQDSFGLTGIRERARLSNGTVSLLTSDTGGVLLRLSIPNETMAPSAGK
jgi:PAS domain S-box-containing protein